MTQIPDYISEDLTCELPSSLRILDMSLPDAELAPKSCDRAVIIPMFDDADRARHIALTFHEAGVITIGMSPVRVDKDVKGFDGIIYTDRYGFEKLVKEMIRQIELVGPVKIGVSDFPWLLHDNSEITITLCNVYHVDKPIQELLESVNENFSRINFGKGNRVALILTINPHESTFTVDELKRLWQPEQIVPKNVDLIWGVHFDNTLPNRSAGALTIIAGEKTIGITDEFDDLFD